MDKRQYRIAIKVPAELVYYVSEYDTDNALELALDAPYKEWEVSYFNMPLNKDAQIEEI